MIRKKIHLKSLILPFLLIQLSQGVSAQVVERDSLALVALYDSTGGANWTDNTGWLSGPVSTWFGITLSADRVDRVELVQNNLVGNIPAQIGDLDSLTFLSLGINSLSDTIPGTIGNLKNLTELQLHVNKLSGTIPPAIGNLTNLKRLFFSSNQLSGQIPPAIGNLAELTTLGLEFNQLISPIPAELGNLANLSNLALYRNQFDEPFPATLLALTNLKGLFIWGNQFSGPIPAGIANLTDLVFLDLDRNQFSGSVPVEITNLTALQQLNLWDNQLIDLPDLSSMTTLTILRIHQNQFTFEDIEPNLGVPTFIYSPQDSVGTRVDTTLAPGTKLTLSIAVSGSANEYQWMKDGLDVVGADSSTYTIDTIATSDGGAYTCRITNTLATELTLYSRPMNVSVEGTMAVADLEDGIPGSPTLYPNYPNPFNPETEIRFALTRSSHVVINIYNTLGQQIGTLIDTEYAAGFHSVRWDGKDRNGSPVSSGVYLYQIQAGEFSQVRKMSLIR